MHTSNKLIVFSGVDGAGKSTQIDALACSLRNEGARVVRLWARGGYTPLFNLLKRCLRRTRAQSLPVPGASRQREERFKSKSIRRMWLIIAMVDLFLYYGIWLRAQLLLGKTVLCDRYYDDTLLDFDRNFPMENVADWSLWRFIVKFSPKPQHQFMLLVEPEESVRRGKLKNEPFPDSLDTLVWRHARYTVLAKTADWVVIDCSGGRAEIQDVIHGVVFP